MGPLRDSTSRGRSPEIRDCVPLSSVVYLQKGRWWVHNPRLHLKSFEELPGLSEHVVNESTSVTLVHKNKNGVKNNIFTSSYVSSTFLRCQFWVYRDRSNMLIIE